MTIDEYLRAEEAAWRASGRPEELRAMGRRHRAQRLGFEQNADGNFLICRNHNCWGDTNDACGTCDANIVYDALEAEERS